MPFLGISDTRLSNVASLLGILAVCILVIAASYFFTRFVGGKQLSQQKNSNFKTIDTFHLAQNKYLMLLEVGRRYFVIAVCKDTVTMISELSQEDITVWKKSASNTTSFKNIFSGMLKNRPGEQEGEGSGKDHPSSGSEYDDDIK